MGKAAMIGAVLSMSAYLINPSVVQAQDLLDTLYKNGVITKEQYEELRRQQQEQEPSTPEEKLPAPAATEQDVIVTTTAGLGGRSPDGAFAFRLRGRLQLDGAYYDDDVQDPGSGSEVRRARISVEGRAWNDWEYELEVDFGEGEVELKDAFLRYIGYEPWHFRVGHIKEPFSLEEQIGSADITFMERALPNVFAPERSVGLGAHGYGDNWTFSTGFFGEGADDKDEQDEGFGLTGRGTYVPILEEAKVIHLGASATYRKTGDDDVVRLRARPESHISGVRFVDTDDISDVDDFFSYGAEVGTVYGPFSIQGEYIATSINRKSGGSDLDFDGFYVYGSWILTGESRTYRDRRGEFGGVTPKSIVGKGGHGAWEIALRYSYLDLNDADIRGGREKNITFGLNCYATPNIRFAFNFIHVDSDKEDIGADDPNIYQARAQIVF